MVDLDATSKLVLLSFFNLPMAVLQLSFVVQSLCLSCGATESTKIIAPARNYYKRRSTRGLRIGDVGENRFHGKHAKFSWRSNNNLPSFKLLAAPAISITKTAEKVGTYLFRTENGGQLRVFVVTRNEKYGVRVELLSLGLSGKEEELVMSWGVFRSDSSCFMPLDSRKSGLDGNSSMINTPFIKESSGILAVELDFDSSLAPFYVSFLLKTRSDFDLGSKEIRSHRETNFVVPVGLSSGRPFPMGLSFLPDGSMNFAIFSRSAEGVTLCLYNDPSTDNPLFEIDLDPYVNRSGDIWHASIKTDAPLKSYSYRWKVGDRGKSKHILLDPYAKIIMNSVPGSLGLLCKDPTFDWGQDVSPGMPMEKLVIYRLNVTRFTKDSSSKLPDHITGTFLGISERLQHFKNLGVNAILLEPIFPFDEKKGPYFPWHFFSPANVYGPSGDPVSAIQSMKEMVKKLHSNGIEVFLEVVFTHTSEHAALEQIDYTSYYCVKGDKELKARHTLNCNYPVVQEMILDCLRHWVIEFHVDGFCFVNSTSLLRGFHGEFLSRPPLVEAIAFDPVLSKVKIIADSWDPHGTELKEIKFPHWKRWAEVNTKFCDDVRNFLRGKGALSDLATRLCGSGDVFLDGRGLAFSFNYVARNVGLSLVDLVSFSSDEQSWNCGEEGPTNKGAVLERRLKQIRNFLFVLFISLGIPVLNMGDECGQSTGGSPRYKDRKFFDWTTLRTPFSIQTMEFISFLSELRTRRSDLLQERSFLKEENIEWHGSDNLPPRWDDMSCKFLAMTLKADAEDGEMRSGSTNMAGDLFVAFNSANHSEDVVLPPLPAELAWFRLVDTALPFPGFFSSDGVLVEEGLSSYEMKSHSCVLFEARITSTS